MLSTPSPDEDLFSEVSKVWNLKKLYVDLAQVKGKELTLSEKKLLCALLCGHSPTEIADLLYQSSNSTPVRVTLSRGLYRYIESLMTQQLGVRPKVDWSRVRSLLEKADYRML